MAAQSGSYSDVKRDAGEVCERGIAGRTDVKAARGLGAAGDLASWISDAESALEKIEARELAWEERRRSIRRELKDVDSTLLVLAENASGLPAASQESVEEICKAFEILPGVLEAVKVRVPRFSAPSWVEEFRGGLSVAQERIGGLDERATGLWSSIQKVRVFRKEAKEKLAEFRVDLTAFGGQVQEIRSELVEEKKGVGRRDATITEQTRQLRNLKK
jgi:chromosome segregation ATPase